MDSSVEFFGFGSAGSGILFRFKCLVAFKARVAGDVGAARFAVEHEVVACVRVVRDPACAVESESAIGLVFSKGCRWKHLHFDGQPELAPSALQEFGYVAVG